ncbi:MAG: HD domain-containing phosphohydrolase [Gemmatimonadota bacterium]
MKSPLDNRVIGDWESRRLLLIEDEHDLRAAMATYLTAHGYDVDAAPSAEEALALLRTARYEIMLSDVRLPGMSGLDLVPHARVIDPDLAIVMLTAMNDAPTANFAIDQGAMEYLTKPIDFPDLVQALARVLRRRQIAVDRKNVEKLITIEVDRRLAHANEAREAALAGAVESIATAIDLYESKDRYLPGTSRRVSALARAIGEEMELAPEVIVPLEVAGRVHDVGRIALRDTVLNKPGPLDAGEIDHVREHVRLGVEILSPLGQLADVIQAVHDHHEHWDGSGYPRGVAGDSISLGGRIVCAADVFVALTSPRSYRPARSIQDAVSFLRECGDSVLDPTVFSALKAVIGNRRLLGASAAAEG